MKISSFCSLLSSIDDCQTVVSLSKQLSTVYHNRQARERVYVGISFEATVRGFEPPITLFLYWLRGGFCGPVDWNDVVFLSIFVESYRLVLNAFALSFALNLCVC